MSVAHVITKGHWDSSGLGCHLGPWDIPEQSRTSPTPTWASWEIWPCPLLATALGRASPLPAPFLGSILELALLAWDMGEPWHLGELALPLAIERLESWST